jgi:hypothetical protein
VRGWIKHRAGAPSIDIFSAVSIELVEVVDKARGDAATERAAAPAPGLRPRQRWQRHCWRWTELIVHIQAHRQATPP